MCSRMSRRKGGWERGGGGEVGGFTGFSSLCFLTRIVRCNCFILKCIAKIFLQFLSKMLKYYEAVAIVTIPNSVAFICKELHLETTFLTGFPKSLGFSKSPDHLSTDHRATNQQSTN